MPTIDDVAAAAGVSRGTVSRVINGGHHVSAAAQQSVERAIKRTGYVTNQSARSLATKQTNTVAFILSEPQERLFDDPNFNVLLRASTNALAAHDMTLVLMLAGTADQRDRVVRYTRAGHVDAAMVFSTHAGDPLIAALVDGPVPVVTCGEPIGFEGRIPFVAADDRGGARRMVQHLVDQGRTHIGTITGPLDTPGGPARLAGYTDVLGRRGRGRYITSAPSYSYESGRQAMATLLASAPDVDAVFVGSDLLAAGALATLRAAGRSVPGDVAVGGFDDSSIAATTDPPLTTIRQPLAEVAVRMTELVRELIAGGHPSSLLLPVELVRRESA